MYEKVLKRDGDRYCLFDNGVIVDKNTSLEWFPLKGSYVSWFRANSWADSLGLRAGGNWRMPGIEELQGLYQRGRGSYNITLLLGEVHWVWSKEIIDFKHALCMGFLSDNHIVVFNHSEIVNNSDVALAVRNKTDDLWKLAWEKD